MKNTIIILTINITLIIISSCGIYSFRGASIPQDAETIYVDYFNIQAVNTEPLLPQIFTEKLKDIFLQQTNLSLSNKNGDLNFSGFISNYEVKPISITSNETASQNRLTISINVLFESKLEKEKNFETTFTRYKDFDSALNFSEIELNLIEEITNEIVEDIFNKSVVNW